MHIPVFASILVSFSARVEFGVVPAFVPDIFMIKKRVNKKRRKMRSRNPFPNLTEAASLAGRA